MNRTGVINFGDASLLVWEESVDEKSFKRDVFKRIVQQLRRMGWSVDIPADMIEQYGYPFACNFRYCRKGDLKAELNLAGRCIEFNMWQSINTPTRPDHDGKYEHDKEAVMPYLLRARMEWTRNRLLDYLRNVFSGYEFGRDTRNTKPGPESRTALEYVEAANRRSWHYKPDLGHAEIHGRNDRSGDGKTLTHGASVFTTDNRGRVVTGTAYYSLNSQWWVVTGRYGVLCKSCGDIYLDNPGELRRKRNQRTRRQRLEGQLANAISTMNFGRAETLKRILFGDAPLFRIWSRKDSAWYGPNFSGYTTDPNRAGKYTGEDIAGCYYETMISDGRLEWVPIEQARSAA